VSYFEAHAEQLDADARRRLHSNPLRILDSKNPAMQALVDAAPRLFEHLGEASLRHFDAVRAVLDAVGQPYRINPRLVRGMDYYNLTCRVGDRSAWGAGHGLRRRALRRPGGAHRRQARPGYRLGHGH
jgi:histidyl-tRNA synthetase